MSSLCVDHGWRVQASWNTVYTVWDNTLRATSRLAFARGGCVARVHTGGCWLRALAGKSQRRQHTQYDAETLVCVNRLTEPHNSQHNRDDLPQPESQTILSIQYMIRRCCVQQQEILHVKMQYQQCEILQSS